MGVALPGRLDAPHVVRHQDVVAAREGDVRTGRELKAALEISRDPEVHRIQYMVDSGVSEPSQPFTRIEALVTILDNDESPIRA
jgi:hypothetical protein